MARTDTKAQAKKTIVNKTRLFLSESKKFSGFPDLLGSQKKGFNEFVEFYLQKLFEDINPIHDIAGEKLQLTITDISISAPMDSVEVCKRKELTYGGIISGRVKIIDQESGEVIFDTKRDNKRKPANIGILPLMTQWGSYIINGVERVVISQIIRSYGIFYSFDKKDFSYSFKLIPENGPWLQIFTEKSGNVVVRINKSRKFPITSLLRIFGLETNESIQEYFKGVFDDEDFDYIKYTLDKDTTSNAEDAAKFIYNKIRPGELIDADSALDYIKSLFLDPDRMRLGRIARRKINAKLGLNKKLTDPNSNLFDVDDMIQALKYLCCLANNKRRYYVDDIDHLSNRRIRTMGEILYSHLQPVMRKFTKSVKGKLSVISLEDRVVLREGDENLADKVVDRILLEDVIVKNKIIIEKGTKLKKSHLDTLKKNKIEDVLLKTIVKVTDLVNFKILDNSIKSFFATSQLSQFLDQINPLAEVEHKRRITALGPGGLKRETTTFEVRDVHQSHYGRICPIETPEGQNIGLVVYQSLYSRLNEDGFVETPAVIVKRSGKAIASELVNRIADEDLFDDKGKKLLSDGEFIDSKKAQSIEKALGKKGNIVQLRPFLTEEIEYISPEFDEKYVIADITIPLDEHKNILSKRVPGRHFMDMEIFHVNDVTHVDVNPSQIFSPNTSLIPFVEHDDAVRAAMGTNMQRQAVPLIKPTSPLVGTGMESDIAGMTYACIRAEDQGEVIYVDGKRVRVKYKSLGTKEYELITFKRSNQKSVIHQSPKVTLGQTVSTGDILAEGPSVVDGEISLGKNLKVAFMSWEGYNYEDAIVISQRLVKDDELTSIHIEEYEIEVADTKLGPEETTNDIPGVSLAKLKNLDEDGIVRIGATVKGGDILVGKITPKSEGELSPEEKLIQAIFGDKSKSYRDTSLYLPSGSEGKIIDVVLLDSKKGDNLPAGVRKKVKVYVARTRKIEVGDKLAGRHGNKGIISVVVPEEDMPFTDDGQSIDIALNPLGVLSRMNIGQTLETQLGMIAKLIGRKFAVPLFSNFGVEDMRKENIRVKLEGLGVPEEDLKHLDKFPENGTSKLYDGRTGIQYENEVTVGYMHILKLVHMVEDKIHARSVGPYSLITQQPLGGKAREGGQRFGEMEVWALEAYSAVYTLQEMLTIKSDDVLGRNKTYEAIVKGGKIKVAGLPESFNLLLYVLKGISQNIVPLTREEAQKLHQTRIEKINNLGLKGITAYDAKEMILSDSIIDSREEKQEIIDKVIEELEDFGELE
ncbi:MAG: DNA-directed RNA polymerase subunit beta [Candidatus Absconditabacteria bacterium]